jgi:hypothetical protein
MTLEEAETLALSTLKQVMEEKVVETTFQLIVVNSLTCVFSLLFLFLVFFLFGN